MAVGVCPASCHYYYLSSIFPKSPHVAVTSTITLFKHILLSHRWKPILGCGCLPCSFSLSHSPPSLFVTPGPSSLICVFLDGIASPSSYPCQSVSQSVRNAVPATFFAFYNYAGGPCCPSSSIVSLFPFLFVSFVY